MTPFLYCTLHVVCSVGCHFATLSIYVTKELMHKTKDIIVAPVLQYTKQAV